MRGMLFVVTSFLVTILCWGVYGPVLHWGQKGMATGDGMARLLPFVCVGLAYFAIGVVVPLAWLFSRGEQGHWTSRGAITSLFAGALGAVGALGIIMAFTFGGDASYVMPLVFGGAPVVNSFITIYLAGRMKEIGPVFLAGLIMVVIGAVVVLVFKPTASPKPAGHEAVAAANEGNQIQDTDEKKEGAFAKAREITWDFVMQLLSIATVIACWGAYGPMLHKGQAAMQNSRMRPLLCVGISYFVIAVICSGLILSIWPEKSAWTFWGTTWSLAAGAAGALGALGIIMAFNFGGKPVYVMPLVFGGAPVVNTCFTIIEKQLQSQVSSFFFAGLILVIAGAAIVLVFAPKGGPPPKGKPPKKEHTNAPKVGQELDSDPAT